MMKKNRCHTCGYTMMLTKRRSEPIWFCVHCQSWCSLSHAKNLYEAVRDVVLSSPRAASRRPRWEDAFIWCTLFLVFLFLLCSLASDLGAWMHPTPTP
jgi:hypothetical protein